MAQVTQQTLDRLRVPSTATLTSVLKGHGLGNTFLHEVAPLRPDTSMAGRAFTLRYIPAREDLVDVPMDNLTDRQRVGIEQMQAADVLVIDARGDTRAGTMGSILAARMAHLGAAGVVTDGAYRDTPAIRDLAMGCYAAAMNGHTNKTIHHPSEYQVPIACGGVAVFPSDIIVGDGEGVVVVPAHLADEVAASAAEQERLEEFLLQRVQDDASIVGTYPPDEDTLSAYRESRRLETGGGSS